MQKYATFTLCAFPAEYKKALSLLGSRPGRDGDKIGQAGVTPTASQTVASPGFAEASLILECNKIYWQDFDPDKFLSPQIEKNYPRKDYHRVYFGEIVAMHEG